MGFCHLIFQLFSDFRENVPNFRRAVSILSATITGGGESGYGGVLVVRELVQCETRPLRGRCDIAWLFRSILDFYLLERSTTLQ